MFGKLKEEDLWSKVRELIDIDETPPQQPNLPKEETEAKEIKKTSKTVRRIKELKEFEDEIKSELQATFRRIFKALADTEDDIKDFLNKYQNFLEDELIKTVAIAKRFRNQLETDVLNEIRERIFELNAKLEDIKAFADEIEQQKKKRNRLFFIATIFLGLASGILAGIVIFFLCKNGFCKF
jgi:DNA-binding protein